MCLVEWLKLATWYNSMALKSVWVWVKFATYTLKLLIKTLSFKSNDM